MKVTSALACGALAAAGFLAASSCPADVALPAIFSSNMVLQRQMAVPVWGRAAPGEQVTVTFAGRQAKATADEDGKWMARLPSLETGGPDQLVVSGRNTITLTNVVVGEVWLCSGQSNMAWPVASVAGASQEIAQAAFPLIRQYAVDRKTSMVPLDDAAGGWQVCGSNTVGGFTAVGYFFGRTLHTNLNVPIGLINSSWGGTRVDAWSPLEVLRRIPEMDEALTNLNPEAIQQAQRDYEAKSQERAQRHRQLLKAEQDEDLLKRMAAPGLDTAGWKTMSLPTPWEHAGLSNFDGLVWFRRPVVVPAAWACRDLVLRLGPVDEADVTSFNGTRVGAMGSYGDKIVECWDRPRVYTVPGALVKAGTNTIAVRVIDAEFAGGLWGGRPGDMRLELAGADESLPLAGDWLYRPDVQLLRGEKPPVGPNTPTALFNAMIHPLVPFAIRGAIWYQGESNCGEGMLYREKFVGMIRGWRELWGEGAFPFYFVQLAPYSYGGDGTGLPGIWQAQKSALELENTGMAVITDITNVRDIHPRRKQEVGRRLALWALNRTYGDSGVVPSGPLFRSMTIADGAARLRFDYADGLRTSDEETPSWFDIAIGTGAFARATARIDGNEIVVTQGGRSNITAVRYGWHEMAQPNLVNGAGLPASPFTSAPEGLRAKP